MRIYLPALSDELIAPHPSNRQGWWARIPSGTHPEEAEVYEDDAITEAALGSLALLRDEDPSDEVKRAHRRLVLAAEVPQECVQIMSNEALDEDEVIFPIEAASLTWDDVVAIMVDDADAEAAVTAVISAQDQDSADEAVSDLWDFAIGWYDIAERKMLAQVLNA